MKHNRTQTRSCQGEIPERPPMFDMRDRWQYKRCGYPVAFQNLENPRITLMAEHGCGKASCPDCRPDWERSWLSSTLKHWGFVSLADDEDIEIRDEDGEEQWVYASEIYHPVYVSTVNASDFESIRRQIKGHARHRPLIRRCDPVHQRQGVRHQGTAGRCRKDSEGGHLDGLRRFEVYYIQPGMEAAAQKKGRPQVAAYSGGGTGHRG